MTDDQHDQNGVSRQGNRSLLLFGSTSNSTNYEILAWSETSVVRRSFPRWPSSSLASHPTLSAAGAMIFAANWENAGCGGVGGVRGVGSEPQGVPGMEGFEWLAEGKWSQRVV